MAPGSRHTPPLLWLSRKQNGCRAWVSLTSAIPGEPPEKKRKKMVEPIPQTEVFSTFFRILEDSDIRLFLARDRCYKISDKYLLAIVLEYLWRARISTENYRRYFFPAL
ncbi:putative speedy protein E13 [Dendropsophus ebraccatus]|uniref:putative speedy protein E13 n=1 Tax=Dendropsophus ebraccatus TaxID=150705 RepID=UPI003831CF93